MTQQGTSRVSNMTRSASIVELIATAVRLVPKQLKDTGSLLGKQVKSKVMPLIIAVVLIVLGLVALAGMFVALVVTLIDAFSSTTHLWFPALMVASAALVLAIIFLAVGGLMIAKILPSLFDETIHGVKYDIGYLSEGTSFDPVEFDRLEAEKKQRVAVEKEREKQLAKDAKKEQKDAVRRGEAAPAMPSKEVSEDELRHRMDLRRRHLGDVRSGIEEKADIGSQVRTFFDYATGKVSPEDRAAGTSPVAPFSAAARAGDKVNDAGDYVKERWQPLTILGASVTSIAVLAKKFGKK